MQRIKSISEPLLYSYNKENQIIIQQNRKLEIWHGLQIRAIGLQGQKKTLQVKK